MTTTKTTRTRSQIREAAVERAAEGLADVAEVIRRSGLDALLTTTAPSFVAVAHALYEDAVAHEEARDEASGSAGEAEPAVPDIVPHPHLSHVFVPSTVRSLRDAVCSLCGRGKYNPVHTVPVPTGGSGEPGDAA